MLKCVFSSRIDFCFDLAFPIQKAGNVFKRCILEIPENELTECCCGCTLLSAAMLMKYYDDIKQSKSYIEHKQQLKVSNGNFTNNDAAVCICSLFSFLNKTEPN